MRNFSLYGVFSLTCACIFFVCASINAQTFNKPEPADNPNLPGNSAWGAACGSAGFNEYHVDFTWLPPLVNSGNEFILELSDANGDFSSPIELDRIDDDNTDLSVLFEFAVPVNVQGDGYRFRVRSTDPAMTGPESDPYSLYYIGFSNPILISPDGNGTIPPGGVQAICTGETIVLATHNVPDPENYNYSWFRSGTPLPETSNSITVDQAGMYYVEIDYGINCSGSANTLSNTIEINITPPLGITISAASSTDICSGETVDLVASINDPMLAYTWYQNGSAITSTILGQSTYTVDGSTAGFEGDYYVEVEGSNACKESSNTLTVTNAGSFDVSLDSGDFVLLPTQTRTVGATTSAGSPTYQWYRNGSPITGETNSTLDITNEGDYFVRVSQSGGACASSFIDSETITAAFPTSFEFTIAHTTSYVACENTTATLGLSGIVAVTSDGTRIDVTTDLSSSFTYQWIRNSANVSGETNTDIIVPDFNENGSYELSGTLSSFNVVSNALDVQLTTGETVEITSDGTAVCASGNTIALATTMDLSSETYEWTRDGVAFTSTDAAPNISEPGVYRLVVQRASCPLRSNEITIVPFDESGVVLDTDDDPVVIPEGGSETITATGASSYEWYDESNNLISNTDSVTLTEEGEYLLIATVSNCEVARIVTVDFKDGFKVPNVITANGDGINDLWVIPNTYSRKSDVSVIIYNEKGEEILNQTNYENNWPQSTLSFQRQNMVFYYKLISGGETLKQGTITVIR